MKKFPKIIISLLLPLVLPINFLYAEDVVPEKIELLPEVKALIAQQETLSTDFFENNLFIGLSGVFYPEDNFYEVASEIFQHNYPEYLKANKNPKLTAKDLTLIKLEDKLPEGKPLLKWMEDEIYAFNRLPSCASSYLLENCISKTVAVENQLQKLMDNNKAVFQHYQYLASSYSSYKDLFLLVFDDSYIGYSSMFDAYRGIIFFVSLSVNQGVLDIVNGQFEEGVEKLQTGRDILLIPFKNKGDTSIFPLMLGTAIQQYIDQFVDGLLSEGYLNLKDERIEKVVAPYPKAFEETLHEVFILDRDNLIRYFVSEQEINNKEINQFYQISTRYLNAHKQGDSGEELSDIEQLCDPLQNEYLVHYCVLSGFKHYLHRYFTQRNYHNMVYLKYLILRDNVADKDIPNFLTKQGEIAIDPITLKPFQWNSENRTISLPLPEMKLLPTIIRIAVSKNPEIKYLQVIIPQ